jgi:flagellar motor protein MotB
VVALREKDRRYMMAKLFLIMAFMLACPVLVIGQQKGHYDKLIAAANQYFEQQQYNLAIGFFKQAEAYNVDDPAMDYKLAECYRNTFNYVEAEMYYLKVLYTGQSKYPLSLYYYALMLKLNGNVTEAIEKFDQFIVFYDNNTALKDFTEQAIIEKAGCDIARHELGVPVPTKAELVGGAVNTEFNDFAPAFRSEDNLVITSSRIVSNRSLIDERDGQAFTDNYYLRRIGQTWQDRTRAEFGISNSTYHDGSGSFTRSGNEYFFTVCEARCQIYETHFGNNKWTRPVALNSHVNTPDWESKQPSVSPGGDTLYFASDRPGGHGQFDIWMSIDAGNNHWSAPVNLGRTINTKANDIAPGVTALPSVLFFSSDGHPGYGGFDLFVAKARSTSDTVLYNLNFPFNSVKDDLFVTFDQDDIYWSSNRDGGKGGFDIYFADKVSPITLVSKLSLKNRNDSRNVTLTTRTARSENINLLASRNEETIDYNNLTYERKTVVNRMVDNRLKNIPNRPEDFAGLTSEEFNLLNDISHVRFSTMLLREKYASTLLTELETVTSNDGALALTGQLVDGRTGSPISSRKVLLTNEYGEILKMTNTNRDGHFRFMDVPGATKLFLRLDNSSGLSVNVVVRDIQMSGSDEPGSHYVENVYFDFDHYVIRPEAAKVLVELAEYLKSNGGSQVEIFAFADDRGSSAYNFELTQKRGEAVAAFLTKHGVDATSLAITPKGKQQMRLATNEIQRQFNRRVEFYINGIKETFTASVKTYILKKETDWTDISKITGVSKEELKDLNGAHTDAVKAFQPVRVPLTAKTISEDLFFVGI